MQVINLVAFIVCWRWWLLAAIVVATLVFSPYLQQASVANNSLSAWFLEDDPKVKDYYYFHDTFANDEVILLKINFKESVFTNSNLNYLRRLIGKLSAVDGVFQIHSILSVQDSIDNGDGLNFEKLIPPPEPPSFEVDLDDDSLRRIAQLASDNDLIHQRFVDDGQRQTLIWIEPIASRDFDFKRAAITREISRIFSEYLSGDMSDNNSSAEAFGLGGLSIIYTALNDITQREAGKFFSLAYLLLLIAMILLIRQWKIILAALITIGLSSTLTFGLYGFFGYQMSLLTVMLPTIVLIIGLTDLIHFPVAHTAQQEEQSNHAVAHSKKSAEQMAINSIAKVLLPCFLTTLTTVFGFLSLALSPMAIIREYAIFTAIGIMLAFFIAVVMMAITLTSIPSYKLPALRGLSSALKFFSGLLINHPKKLAAGFVLSVPIAVWAMTFLKVDTYTLGYFDSRAQVVRDHNFISDQWGAYGTVEFMLLPKDGENIDDAALLNSLATFALKLKDIEGFHQSYHFDRLYQRMIQVFTDTPPRTALSDDLIEQLNLMLDGEFLVWDKQDPEYTDNFLSVFTTKDKSLGRLTVIADIVSAQTMKRSIDQAYQLAETHLADYAEIKITGYAPLYIQIIDYVMSVQMRSLIYVVVMLFLVFLLWTRSLVISVISLIPNIFPALAMFSTMAILGINLDIGTVIIAAIVIGISIDDTIHFLHHWREAEKQGLTWHENIEHTYRYAGRAMMLTTILFLFGFPVMMLSELKTVFYFGLLTTVAVVSAIIADLLLFPLLLRWCPAGKTPRR